MNKELNIRVLTPIDGDIKETKLLNLLSAANREFQKKQKVQTIEEEGFEIGFDGRWEYHIKHKSGQFLVFKEDRIGNGGIQGWYYSSPDDLDWDEFYIKPCKYDKKESIDKFNEMVKGLFSGKIKFRK